MTDIVNDDKQVDRLCLKNMKDSNYQLKLL